MLRWQTLDDGTVAARIVSASQGDLFTVFMDEDDNGYFYEIKDKNNNRIVFNDGFENAIKVRDAAEEHAKRLAMKMLNGR